MILAVAEIIDLEDIVQARARRRNRALTAQCLTIMEDSLATSRRAYGEAAFADRLVWAHKIRQLEDLIAYTTNLV